MSPWTKQVYLGAAKLLSNYFTCRKQRDNIQPCNPNVKWLLELLKKSWPLLPPIQIIVYFAFFLSQTSLPWTNLFCFFSKSNFSTATNSYACIGSCSGRGDWWQRVTWSGLPHHSTPCMHLQQVGVEADQTMHLWATRVGLRSTRRAQARAAVHARSVLDRTRRKSTARSACMAGA